MPCSSALSFDSAIAARARWVITHGILRVAPRATHSCRIHSFLRRGACRDAIQCENLERRQRAAVERGGQSGASRVGDLGAVEVERLEFLQPSSRRRQRTCRRRRRYEGGDALVTERILPEIETLQRGQPPQGRREGHQPRVADGRVDQREFLEPRQGASAQGGCERRGACVAHMNMVEKD
eukprot:scaffold79647_cov59-Phaeocystis_antarctica.AAC.2